MGKINVATYASIKRYRVALNATLSKSTKVNLIESYYIGSQFYDSAEKESIQVLILDYAKHDEGLEILNFINKHCRAILTLIRLGRPNKKLLEKYISYGANGIVRKPSSMSDLELAIESVVGHGVYIKMDMLKILGQNNEPKPKENKENELNMLSFRENAVAHLAVQELSNVEIAAELSISVNTVKSHKKNIYKKLGVKTNLGLATAFESIKNQNQR